MLVKIFLNEKAYKYLLSATFIPKKMKPLLSLAEEERADYVLKISEDQADDIRDLCIEQLQVVGFDEKYEPTEEGVLLESLIDKFYIG